MSKKVVIVGAGPAGLTAAYELLRRNQGYEVIVFEESECFGGISKTVTYKGNRMDMGGHRFFTKVPEVNDWWEEMLPMQGAVAWDDLQLARPVPLKSGGPNPAKVDEVMLTRHRVSRIFFDGKFYDYPISIKWETFKNMGLGKTIIVGFSYIKAMLFKKPENNLENFYINRFGRKLYSMFFKYYTENLWGRHPSEIDASWGNQRVKGISILEVVKNAFGKMFGKKDRKVETSLIEQFKYPKLGPGQLWEVTAEKVVKLGGKIRVNAQVDKISRDSDGKIVACEYVQNGERQVETCDILISSMPLKDLVLGMNDVPADVTSVAAGLPYRDYMTLGVLVNKLNLENKTSFETIGNIVPDCWVYVQDRRVKLGRFQIYNNWSPYMVADLENTVWLGLEYFVQEGDDTWNMTEEEFSKLGISEMIKIGIISDESAVLDTHMEKVKKAYPAYFDTYDQVDTVIDFVSGIENLYCVGRNGQHRYNNIDHSMVTSFEAVKNIVNGVTDKSNIWNVNTEQEYHEEKSEEE